MQFWSCQKGYSSPNKASAWRLQSGRVRATAWGVDNEEMAIKAFTALTCLVPVQTDLWLHKSGVLGASPGKENYGKVKRNWFVCFQI